MPNMTDPAVSLRSMQKCFKQGVHLECEKCRLVDDMVLHVDEPIQGTRRMTYIKLIGRSVIGICVFAVGIPINGIPCFEIGYAVDNGFRRRGIGRLLVRNSINELSNGFRQFPPFFIEAVIGRDNVSSIRIAQSEISNDGEAIIDELSQKPAFCFRRLMNAVSENNN